MSLIARPHLNRRLTGALATVGAGLAVLVAADGGIAAAGPNQAPAAGKGPTAPRATTQNLGAHSVSASAPVLLAAGGYASTVANCPAGQVVLGGGESNGGPGTLVLTDSAPLFPNAWLVWVKNTGTTAATFTAYAVCGT